MLVYITYIEEKTHYCVMTVFWHSLRIFNVAIHPKCFVNYRVVQHDDFTKGLTEVYKKVEGTQQVSVLRYKSHSLTFSCVVWNHLGYCSLWLHVTYWIMWSNKFRCWRITKASWNEHHSCLLSGYVTGDSQDSQVQVAIAC